MPFDPRTHPRWLAAIARERELRAAAYLGLPTPIADGALQLSPLTLRQQIVLLAAENPIAIGGGVTEEDSVAFLWVVDPAYAPGNQEGCKALFARLRELNLDWEQVCDDLSMWYAEQTLDDPKPSRIRRAAATAPAVSNASVQITSLWIEGCPMSREEILDSPVACLNQERRALVMRHPKHGLTGGPLSNAVEKELILERRKGKPSVTAPAI